MSFSQMLCNMIVEGELDPGCRMQNPVRLRRFACAAPRGARDALCERLGNYWKIIVPAGALP
jgi:hypothetical protein